MTKTLDLYFDFGSPTAYLAYKRLLQLSSQYGLTINYIPILLGGIFKASGNTSPVSVAAKGKYMLEADLPRFAKRYGVALNFNPHFPINTLPLMRGAIAAQQLNCFDAYAEAIYNGFWVAQKNLGELDTISATLSSAGIDAEALLAKATQGDVKQQLIANTDAAVARGAFGAPTMFMDGEMYFGQDRLDFVEQALANSSP